MRRWFAWLPLAIGASILVGSWFYLMWNTTAGELVPALRFRTKATIAGIMQESAPALSLDAVLTGRYQQWVSRSIGRLSPIFKPAIGWKGQIYYALGAAGSDRVSIGKGQQLFEMLYLDEYCKRNLATLRAAGEDWAARIRRLQDFFDARGQVFVYLITPSKIAEEPQIIPDNYACPAPAKDRAEKLPVYDDILSRHGIRFIDAASNLAAARQEYGISMFSRGGIHWNGIGAALGTQKLIATVNAQRSEPLLTPFSFTWRVSYNPQAADRDLLDLMNLRYPDTHYPVPELTYHSDPRDNCRSARITEIGGSFLARLNDTLGKLACPPEINQWFYWERNWLHYVNGRLTDLPIDAAARRRSLLDADVVVFEENDSLAPDSSHGKLLMQAVAAMAGE